MNTNANYELESSEHSLEDFNYFEEKLNDDIRDAFGDLELLENEKIQLTNPDALGKTIYDSIFSQLGAQSGMDISGETLIGQYKKNHVGENSQSANMEALRDKKYQEVRKSNTDKSKSSEGIRDDYTGKIVKFKDGHQINTDHVVSRNEIYGKDGSFKKKIREFSGNEVKDLANLSKNLKATNESLNKSKSDKSTNEYLEGQEQRKKDLSAQNKKANDKIKKSNRSESEKKAAIEKNNQRLKDKLDADPKLMSQADKNARKAINKKIAKDATVKLGKEAGVAALRGMIMSATLTLVKNIIDGLVIFFKSHKKNLTEFFNTIKKQISSFFGSIKNIFKNGISGGVGSIVNNIMSFFGETFGKIWGAIKQGFTTIKSAFKIFTDQENKELPLSVKLAKFSKVVSAGIVGAGVVVMSASLGEVIENTIPGLKGLKLPIIGSVTSLIIEIILGIFGGILTGIIINYLNKFISSVSTVSSDQKIIIKQNELLSKQNQQIAVLTKKKNIVKKETTNTIHERHSSSDLVSKGILDSIFEPVMESDISFEKMQSDLNTML